ncbi:MAG: aldose 1-epimerase [Anaerolineae bacterium]|nr:aldose 1-epimerase [Anaerolineae bacterium]
MPVTEITLGRTIRALQLENERLTTTVLLDKGADIYELIYKPHSLDVMWKSPWGLKEPGVGPSTDFNSEAVWLEHYAGGWQELFPNGGTSCHYKGVQLSFHGEASVIPWEYEILNSGPDTASVRLHARLRRSPFTIERWMRLEGDRLSIQGKVTNHAGEPMDYMWSHHPAFGAPFLSAACRIDTGARHFRTDDSYVGFNNPLTLDTTYDWPLAGDYDLSRVPGPESNCDVMTYLTDFESAWYAITNTEMGVGVGMAWPKEMFPYAWFWQELNGSSGFPFYKNSYVMAIEPASSIPGGGLVNVMEKTGTHRTLQPGESAETTLQVVFYESKSGVEHIAPDGTVTLR